MSEHTKNCRQKRRRHDVHDGDVSGTFCGRAFKDIRTMELNTCMKNPILQSKSAVVNMNTAVKLACGDTRINYIFVDVHDNTKIEDAKKMFTDTYADVSTQDLFLSDSDMKLLDEIKAVFYLMFVITFLLVIFVTASICNRIVNERMSLIGTLRSIGGSIRSTGFLLLAESAFYGLCGGILGTTAFMPFRSNTDLGYFSAAVDIEMEISDGITPLSVCLVILSVILLQCIFSAAAIFRASQKPVRDIIFGTKETAYLPSKLFTTVGIILLILGAVSYMTSEDFTMIVLAALCSAIGAVMLFPMIVKIVSNVLADVFHKSNMPVAKLAVKEIASKKSSISSFQLILSAMSLTIAMVVLSNSMIKLQYIFLGWNFLTS